MNTRKYKFFKRALIHSIGIMLTTNIVAQPFDLNSFIPGEMQAVEKGKELGIGSVELVSPEKQVEVNSYQSFKLLYTAGKSGIKPGGKIIIGMRHLLDWTKAQTTYPHADGYLTAITSNNAPVTFTISQNDWESPYFWKLFPWQNAIICKIGQPGLKTGEKLTIVLGDRSKGSKGIQVQSFDEFPFVFKCYADINGTDEFLPLAENPYINIVSAAPYRLNLVMPSGAQVGEPTWCIVRAEDRYGNPATKYQGNIKFSSTGKSSIPGIYRFQPGDSGVHKFRNVIFNESGIVTITVTDGELIATGNPVQVKRTKGKKNLFWGDIHGHTIFSDGRGTVEQFYDFAENVAGLDFCAVTEHGFELTDEMWLYCKEITNAVYKPDTFVTFQAYEWSGMTEVGGDHNVYFLDDDPSLYRSRSYYNYQNYQYYHGDDPQINHVEDLFKTLDKEIEAKRVFTIPHYGGRPGNPKWHHHKVDRNIEVFSEHQRSEYWMKPFHENGHRLGIMASTDGHFGNPGYGYLKFSKNTNWDEKEIGMALMAVYAEELTRESIFRAIYNRHVYATTGERIILNFRVNNEPMGSEINSETLPELSVHVVGSQKIRAIYIKKDSEIVKTFTPDKTIADVEWTDDNFKKDKSCYYYIHVIQVDDEEAISSPVWVN